MAGDCATSLQSDPSSSRQGMIYLPTDAAKEIEIAIKPANMTGKEKEDVVVERKR
jgi:hypothetical protein